MHRGDDSGVPSDRVGHRPAAIVLLLAVGAALWALMGSQRLFTYLSDDHDEGLYLLQANALAEGHLFPPAPGDADAFRPFLSVVSDGRFVLKYAPVHASILAVGIRLTGDARPALAVIAAGVVVLSYGLAKEVLGDRMLAALASAFLALSPLFVVQSATFLPYCSELLLLEGFALALLRGLRSDSRPLLSLSGFVLGAALFARPFDAVLWAVPLGLYGVWSQRSDRRRLARHLGWFALGAALPVVLMLLYYRAATGSPFRSPFNLLEPQDTLGFGRRRLVPGQPELVFTPVHGTYAIIRYAVLTSAWVCGGLILVGLFVANLRRRRLHGAQPWLAMVLLSFAAGYMFFWGTFGTSLKGSLTSFLGPFYFLPVLVPLTFLAARSFGDLWRHDRVIGGSTLVGMLVVSGYLLFKVFQVNLDLTAEDRRVYAPIAAARLERALVLLPPLYGAQLLHPFAYLQNDADYDGRTVYALDLGERRSLDLLHHFPGRDIYKLRVTGVYRANPTDPRLRTSLEPVAVVDRASVTGTVAFDNPTGDPEVVVSVALNGTRDSFVLDTESSRSKHHEVTLSIGPGSVEARSPVEAHVHERAEDVPVLSISVSVRPADGGEPRTLYERHVAYDTDGKSLRMLLPGEVSVNQLGPEDPLQAWFG
jgi:4-amino-4-deoxy-L-arabinose transferase-like glycosyltransferase